jgi:hypothetical protein
LRDQHLLVLQAVAVEDLEELVMVLVLMVEADLMQAQAEEVLAVVEQSLIAAAAQVSVVK